MRRGLWSLLLAMAGLAACAPSLPEAQPRYLVGGAYELAGEWSYPAEDFALIEQGLAVVLPPGRPRLTANGEHWDDAALLAAHRTLQLPAILRVTNLETGRALLLRLNDRGPAVPGRMLGVSPRAGELLGAAPGAVFQARLEVLAEPSRALAEALDGERRGPVLAAAPVAEVRREALAAPEGSRALPAPAARLLPRPEAPTPPGLPPLRLPEEVEQGPVRPGLLWVEAAQFFSAAPARLLAARLGGRAEPLGPRGRQQEWRVRLGPFMGVGEADAALAAARRAGAAGARIVVE
ncbi:MAG: SPOR domain-containing protein [Rhodovarius sp.]|nr:SPOR domain-containing protein [Rhodovarius sp.]